MLADDVIISQFEDMSLPPSELSHVSHLRIAWLYLRQYELEKAIAKVAVGTRSYAENLGVYDKFHHTVTEATVRLVKLRMESTDEEDFDSFLRQNKDMVIDLKSLLDSCYSQEVMASDIARHEFVKPDKQPLK